REPWHTAAESVVDQRPLDVPELPRELALLMGRRHKPRDAQRIVVDDDGTGGRGRSVPLRGELAPSGSPAGGAGRAAREGGPRAPGGSATERARARGPGPAGGRPSPAGDRSGKPCSSSRVRAPRHSSPPACFSPAWWASRSQAILAKTTNNRPACISGTPTLCE